MSRVKFGHYSQATWTPKQIPGLVLWLKADTGVTLNGTTVSAWADQSGNNNHFTQATASQQPLFESTGFNGKPCIKFDGVDDNLRASHISAINNKPGLVIGFVLQVYSRGVSGTGGLLAQRSVSDGFVVDTLDNHNGWRLAHPGGGGWSYSAAINDRSTDIVVLLARFFAGENYLRKNGLPLVKNTFKPPGNTIVASPPVQMILGSRESLNPTGFAAVRIREVVVATDDLSGVDHLGSLETYLRTRRDP